MSRATLILRGGKDRAQAIDWIGKAPPGTIVEFRASKRTLAQNSLMWSLLTQVSVNRQHAGRKHTPDEWKAIFMQAMGKEMDFVPTLDGNGFFPLGHRSSKLTKQEMTDLIEFILAWGAEQGVNFREVETA